MIWLAAIAAVTAYLINRFALYLESWQPGKKICLGYELSDKWADIGNYGAIGLLWLARFLQASTIILLIVQVVDRYF